MNNKKSGVFFIVAVALIAALAVSGGDFKYAITQETIKFAIPNYGHIECVQSPDGEIMAGVTDLPQGGQWITCPKDTKTCDVYVSADAQSGTFVDKNEIFWALCDPSETDCKGGVIEQSGNGALLATRIPIESNSWADGSSTTYLTKLTQGYKLYLMYLDSTPTGSWTFAGETVKNWQPVTDAKARYYFKYTPYVLRMVNGMGQLDWLKGNGCNLPNRDLIISSTDGTKNPKDCSTNACEFGGYINWVDFWTSTEIFKQSLVTYGGSQYFCANGLNEAQLYSLGEMQTTYGKVKFPQTIAQRVTCCPDTVIGDKTCSSDFKWVQNTPTEKKCFSDAECLGAGRWMTQTDGVTQKQYGCDTGTGKCKVTATRTVECSEVKPCAVGTCYTVTGTCVNQGTGTLPPASGKGCLKDSECDDNTWYTLDSCQQTYGEKLISKAGTCKNEDISAYLLIGGAFAVGIVVLAFATQKK